MSTIMEMPATSGPMLTPDSEWGVSMRAMNDGEWATPTSQTPDRPAAGAETGNAAGASESDDGVTCRYVDG